MSRYKEARELMVDDAIKILIKIKEMEINDDKPDDMYKEQAIIRLLQDLVCKLSKFK